MTAPRFHELTIKRVSPEAAGSVAITFESLPPSAKLSPSSPASS